MKPPALTDYVTEWVTERYLRDRKASTAKEIAKGTGLSEARVRKALDAAESDWTLTSRQQTRTSYSTNYRFMTAGAHRVRVYEPSKAYLVELINRLRATTQEGVKP